MAPVTFVYFCYGWTLWTFLTWVPQFMQNAYKMDLNHSALFSSRWSLFGGVVGDALGGWLSATYPTGARAPGARAAGPGDLRHGRVTAVFRPHPATSPTPRSPRFRLGGAFFFAEITIGPMWAIPMDIAPTHSGTASGLMNSGSALAAILSPLVFGYIIDATGNWSLPFWARWG